MLDGIDIGIVIWLLTGLLAGVGEMLTGTLFLVPFLIGAVVAGIAVVLGADMVLSVITFGVTTLIVFGLVLRFGLRFRNEPPATREGAHRYVDARGVVTKPIGTDIAGAVVVDNQTWRALSASGAPIDDGTRVHVIKVNGNALVVEPD